MSGFTSPPPDRRASEVEGDPGTPRAPASAGGLARLVHDLRNPLNTISMSAELVALETDGETSEELGESLATLERAVGELERGFEALEAHVARRDDGGADG